MPVTTQQEKLDAELKRMRDRERELSDIRHVMQSATGRRFIWRVLSEARIFEPCFTGNSHTFYNEGRREHGLIFFKDVMESCPEEFRLAQNENFKSENE